MVVWVQVPVEVLTLNYTIMDFSELLEYYNLEDLDEVSDDIFYDKD